MEKSSHDSLRDEVLALAEIAKACPENLQEKCFELLVGDLLSRTADRTSSKGTGAPASVNTGRGEEERTTESPAPPADESSDIATTDVHVKARHFLQKYGLSLEDVNQVLYKEGDSLLPLYDDLKTTRMSESQVRLALLDAFASGLRTGDFAFDGERVREACNVRKCYDPKNFAANFRNNATLFEAFDGYSKEHAVVRLSEDGRKELAELIRELL